MSTVNVLYFARLREAFGVSAESVSLDEGATVGDLIRHLQERGDSWSSELGAGRPFRIAVNQEMAAAGHKLGEGDEVAIFPPVTGG